MYYINEILVFIFSVLLCLYIWLKHNYSYWKRNNVPFIKPKLLFGNLADIALFRKNIALTLQDLYKNESVKNEPIVGIYIFHKPALLIRSPEIIKQILIKDFSKFSNRYGCSDPHGDKITAYNLFFLKNPQWRQLRNKLTPIFTSGKMKQMFHLFNEIGKKMDSYLCSLPLDDKTKSIRMEMKEMFSLYTTDVIASIAFGVEANCLKDPNCEFRRNGRAMFQFSTMRAIEFSAVFFLPELVTLCKFKLLTKEASEFLKSAIGYVIRERQNKGLKRNDIIDALLALRETSKCNEDKGELDFDDDMLVAQAALFFTGGFETTASTMSFALNELSMHPECQHRLRDEIKEVLVKHNGDITYEAVQNMTYLNMVLQEVLRLYPLMPFLDRECSLYDGETHYSLEPFSEFSIPNRMPLYISIFALHRDPEYFNDPESFNPERFAPENKDNILPFTYLPFGTGPRNCIGERFGLVQVKVGLINFFRNHYVLPSNKTHKDLKFNTKALLMQVEGGINCDIVRDPLF